MDQVNKTEQNVGIKITTATVLFFDLDGTLVYTNLANFLSYKKAIQSVTKQDQDLTYNADKRFNRSNLKNAVPNLSEIEYERIIQEKEKYYKDFLHKAKLNRELLCILSKYSKTNQTILVTNCREDRALQTLNYFELTDKFSNIFFRQFSDKDKKVNKFEKAIAILGLSPKLIVAFENEEKGIADAKKAGIEIVNPKIV